MADEAEVLHCNILKCRRVLSEAAVVTSCSHVFCLDCSNAQFHPDPSRRICPACKTALPSAEEVYVQNLEIGFESRGVFLAGLPPALILDMATKAINFFVYQQSQEQAFQRLLLKKAQDRATNYSKQYENVVREATNEIQTASDKVAALQAELEQAKMRNRELKQQQKQAQAGYTKLRTQMNQMKHRKGPSSAHSAEEVAETLLSKSRLDDQVFTRPSQGAPGMSQPFNPASAQTHPRQSWLASGGFHAQTASRPLTNQAGSKQRAFGQTATSRVPTPRLPARQTFAQRPAGGTPVMSSRTQTPSLRSVGRQPGQFGTSRLPQPANGGGGFSRPSVPTFAGSA